MSDQEFMSSVFNDRILKQYATVNISWEALAGPKERPKPIWKNRSRWWLMRRRIVAWLHKSIGDYGLKREYLEYEPCYECGGEVVPTTEGEYVAGWEDVTEDHDG